MLCTCQPASVPAARHAASASSLSLSPALLLESLLHLLPIPSSCAAATRTDAAGSLQLGELLLVKHHDVSVVERG
jgi:hypothetical protein